jgi:hypothetical protein
MSNIGYPTPKVAYVREDQEHAEEAKMAQVTFGLFAEEVMPAFAGSAAPLA